ncbi:hypothetical protein AJ85_03985 [Alkalihalobacillus alcalophilus ATCC 27647 = CGMCC 1.3604]|uniref:Uncharacterized protein n=1 Tax=Alkalihalobacillus alcalophilus ATCC 27647 = CGMCC 1.3604 TaxID=1218173 RepID=A0A4S4K3N9_ALKAL|nr:hypothetical protein [Alkalihalobacillus alcalophilus]MED1563926.1 hypothetical protein [Alkalihalobacillus alcalophilus]THG91587.1 hypothetical protein AJ85_03985 [Alkalihalobacillus alcalophilus ATCC 27647 = CGMCC 1.3604]
MEIDFGVFLFFVSIVLGALVIRWIKIIKLNSNLQVEQNKEIITLLKEIKEGKKH